MTHIPCDRLATAIGRGAVRIDLQAPDFASTVRALLAPALATHLAPARVDEVIGAVLRREESGSTCAGAVSLPHARVTDLSSIVAAIGLNRDGLYDADGPRVMLAFASPQDAAAEHLRFLSEAAKAFRDPRLVAELLALRDPEQLLARLQRGIEDVRLKA